MKKRFLLFCACAMAFSCAYAQVDEKTAADDACRIEHYMSDKTFDAIKAHMAKYGS